MSRSTKISAVILLAVAVFFIFRQTMFNKKILAEESEIKIVLESLYKAEMDFFRENGTYTADFEAFKFVTKTNSPTLAGILPDCKTMPSAAVHLFLGPSDDNFQTHARNEIEQKTFSEKCTDHTLGFIAFAAQNLDEDEGFELWTIDEKSQTAIILSD